MKEETEQTMQTFPEMSFNTDVLITICCYFHCPIPRGCGGITVLYLLLISLCCRTQKTWCADSEESHRFTLAAFKIN